MQAEGLYSTHGEGGSWFGPSLAAPPPNLGGFVWEPELVALRAAPGGGGHPQHPHALGEWPGGGLGGLPPAGPPPQQAENGHNSLHLPPAPLHGAHPLRDPWGVGSSEPPQKCEGENPPLLTPKLWGISPPHPQAPRYGAGTSAPHIHPQKRVKPHIFFASPNKTLVYGTDKKPKGGFGGGGGGG